MLAGAGLAFARAVGEFGSVVLISGNLPFKTEVASSWIFSLSQSDDLQAAAAVSVVLVAIALVVLIGHRRSCGGRFSLTGGAVTGRWRLPAADRRPRLRGRS